MWWASSTSHHSGSTTTSVVQRATRFLPAPDGEHYVSQMEITVTALRADLAGWMDRVQEGEEVVITRRGRPVTRLLGVGATSQTDRLVAQGVVTQPRRAKSTIRRSAGVRASGPVADLVEEMSRSSRT